MTTYISRPPDDRSLPPFPRGLAVLGSTGSIGESALSVAREHPGFFRVEALAGARNITRLAEQAAEFRPPFLAVLSQSGGETLRTLLPPGYHPEILTGPEAYVALAELPEVGMVLSAIVGAAGLPPTLAAVRSGKAVALANKESLVLGGHLIRQTCARSGAVILPVDSEHNALYQAMVGHDGRDVVRLILTASGGPFRTLSPEELARVTPEAALKHPNWSMGAKITIDSATLMNKGLEVIEACHLYGLPQDQVDVLVHPQSIVHSLAVYRDGSVLAHLGQPDMRLAIAYCLCHPRRLDLGLPPLDLARLGSLTFEPPRREDFPCLDLARRAAQAGPSHCVVLNAANEVAVEHFLQGKIPFPAIAETVARALDAHTPLDIDDLETILQLDMATRLLAAKRLMGTA